MYDTEAPGTESVRAADLNNGDVILIEPHEIRGEIVGRREVLAEVARARYADGAERIVIDWAGIGRLPNGDAHTLGVAVYGRTERVTRLCGVA